MAAPSSYFGRVRRAAEDPELRARDERLEALKAVVGKLAHDFNNFLVPQFGYLTLIAEELAAESASAQYLKTAENAARTTEGYIETILLAVRPQRQYSPKDFDLGSVFAELVEHWSEGISPATEVSVEQSIVPAPLHGDERHWRKAIEHLLANARYALATGGRLHATLEPVDVTEADQARLGLETAPVYRLEIADSGFGMSEAERARAFEPFFTSHAQTRGSGLGLTIVHSVTQFHGGQVELESQEDGGTRVTLWIPRTPPAVARAAAGGLLRQRPARKRKVLLVEDDALIREVIRTWLAAHELDTQFAENAADAGKLLARDPAQWVLAITETTLKNGRGEEVYEQVKKVEGLSCLFLAGPEGPRLQGEGPPVLQKPLSRRVLIEAVERYVRPVS